MKPGASPWAVFVLLLNTAGLLVYLTWLALFSGQVLYTQDGVLYVLPCLPFVFVYVSVLAPQARDDEEGNGKAKR